MKPVKIDKGVPLPPSAAGRASKYPYREVKVRDSFFVPLASPSVRAMAARWGVATGFTFAVRVEGKGCRVWRVK